MVDAAPIAAPTAAQLAGGDIQSEPPKVLVQWLPTRSLRRRLRRLGGSHSHAGEVRQVGVRWHDPEYAEILALADIEEHGVHAGQFFLQVGFKANVINTAGGWSLGGVAAKPSEGRDTARTFAEVPSRAELAAAALEDWQILHQGEEAAEAERQAEMRAVRATVWAYAEHRARTVAEQVERGKTHPMFSMEAFNKVAHTAEATTDLTRQQVETFVRSVHVPTLDEVHAAPENERAGGLQYRTQALQALGRVAQAACSARAALPALQALREHLPDDDWESFLRLLPWGQDAVMAAWLDLDESEVADAGEAD